MPNEKNPYKLSDKFREKLKAEIRKEFNYVSVLSFDELNVIPTQETVRRQYERMDEFNRTHYREIVEDTMRRVKKEWLTPEERSKVSDLTAIAIVGLILTEYNSITGYVYESETDRKRMRQTEGMLAAKESRNRDLYRDTLQRSSNLWYTQSAQYGDTMIDGTEMRMMKKAGINYVQWKTENDSRVCEDCGERNNKVYPIEKVPSKPHYGCRCRIVPYRGISPDKG